MLVILEVLFNFRDYKIIEALFSVTDSTRADIVVVKGSLRDRAMVTLKYQESTLVLTYTVYHHQGGYLALLYTRTCSYGGSSIVYTSQSDIFEAILFLMFTRFVLLTS